MSPPRISRYFLCKALSSDGIPRPIHQSILGCQAMSRYLFKVNLGCGRCLNSPCLFFAIHRQVQGTLAVRCFNCIVCVSSPIRTCSSTAPDPLLLMDASKILDTELKSRHDNVTEIQLLHLQYLMGIFSCDYDSDSYKVESHETPEANCLSTPILRHRQMPGAGGNKSKTFCVYRSCSSLTMSGTDCLDCNAPSRKSDDQEQRRRSS